jgi:hypothetical protein
MITLGVGDRSITKGQRRKVADLAGLLSQGLKAPGFRVFFAALEGPLFHGMARGLKG